MFPDDFHIFLFVCGKLACEREKRKEFWVNIDAKTDSCAKQAANNNQNIEEEKYQTIIIIIKEIEKKIPFSSYEMQISFRRSIKKTHTGR